MSKYPTMRKTFLCLVACSIAATFGCSYKKAAPSGLAQHAEKSEIVADRVSGYMAAKLGGDGGEDKSLASTEQKLIRTASLDLVVNDIQATLNDVGSLASAKGGYVEESSTNGEGQNDFNASMKIRVPAAHLDASLSEIKKLAVRTLRESVQAQDVTRQYVDTEARLRTMRAEEQQYLTILKRASTVKDTVEVTEKLGEIRTEIEQTQAELKSLVLQIDMSLITISFRLRAPAASTAIVWTPRDTVKSSLHDLAQGIADWADVLLSLLIELPLILLWVATIGIAALIIWKPSRFVWRRFRKTQPISQPAASD